MASQFLDGSNIRAALDEVCGKRVAEGMARRSFRETCHRHGIPYAEIRRDDGNLVPSSGD